jgi:predicted cobalt transporter CbtA
MSIFRSIVFSAVIAGGLVGIVVTGAQQLGTVPLILKAEAYERVAEESAPKSATANTAEHANHEHIQTPWEPREGLERNLFTAAANILTF